MRRSAPLLALAALALVLPAGASGHAERLAYYPDHRLGKVPNYKQKGPHIVVCKGRQSRRKIKRIRGSSRARKVRRRNLRLLRKCRFRHIQKAIDAASNGTRILVLPGLYKEQPSRRVPEPDPACEDLYEEYPDQNPAAEPGTTVRVASYEYQRNCPNAQNLIAIIGDGPDEDRRCDDKCDIHIYGTGLRPNQVVISGDRSKLNLIRVDRADGVHLRNFLIQFSDFNNIYALETNGFRFERIVSRWSREYGFLSFTSDNGLYRGLVAYGSGDSGIYPGSGPEGRCERYGIEIDGVNSYGNNMGYSGTAGNGVYVHDSKFHNNAAGVVTDSFVPGHPGMPQDCAKWEHNEIYSNNLDLFDDEHDRNCDESVQSVEERDPKYVCSAFGVPLGSGVVIAGGNDNLIKDNWIYDNWRTGTYQLWVPSGLRGEDPTGQSENSGDQFDVSNGNRYEGNMMGVRPDGTPDPNGIDFYWDEEGARNCWIANFGPGGAAPVSDPAVLPGCPGSPVPLPGNQAKQAGHASCATWDPQDPQLREPPGCDWFDPVSEP